MAGSVAFDPNGAVRFDLKSGTTSDSGGQRLVLFPADAFETIDVATAGRIGAEVGRGCGGRVANRLGGATGVRGAQLEDVVNHLAGELAIAGVGTLVVERWGRAMVAVVTNSAAADAAVVTNAAFLEGVLAHALEAASGQEVSAVALGKDGSNMPFFIGSAQTAKKVKELVERGSSYAEAVAAVQGGVA